MNSLLYALSRILYCTANLIYTCVSLRFGLSLIAIMETDLDKVKDQEKDHKLILNPGPNYILKNSDYCFYLSKVKEEHTRIVPEKASKMEERNNKKQQQREKNYGEYGLILYRNKSVRN